jgi:hypothetical protein
MSYHVFFSFSTGFSCDQRVPKGTLQTILEQIEHVEELLGLKRTPNYTPEGEPQRPGWHWRQPGTDMLATAGSKPDTTLPQWWLEDRERDRRIAEMACAVRGHNEFVRTLYEDLCKWPKRKWTRGESERITVAQSLDFWGGLQILELPRDLWDRDHYTDHMEHLHELLTTGTSRGVTLDCKPFNAKQAGALIMLLEDEIDQWGYDARFAVPLDAHLKPYDFIASSYDGGYDWCSKCGPINSDDFRARCRVCPHAKHGKCELKNDHPAEFEDEP